MNKYISQPRQLLVREPMFGFKVCHPQHFKLPVFPHAAVSRKVKLDEISRFGLLIQG
jgi:hypothetical protein